MPRNPGAATRRRAGERTTARVPAKTSGKRAGPAEIPVQTGAGTSKDVMTTVVQTEPGPEEIAEIVLIVFDFKDRHIDHILQDAQVGCLG